MHVLYTIQGPLSETARESFDKLSFDFVENLTLPQALTVYQAVSWFDFHTKGKGQLREFQLRSTLKTLAGENVVIRAGTGYGKTMTMILPLLLNTQPSKIALTISPMKLLQKNHVEEFNQIGIPSIQTNEDTPDDSELWKKIVQGHYKNIFIAPEQLFRLKGGHVPRLASLMATHYSFLESIGFIFIDEAHFIVLSGFPQQGEKDAFRPVYSRLGEILPLLRENPPIVILSATLPPPILHTVLETLHLDPSMTTMLMESINRPNHTYAVRQLYGGIKNLKNYDFLVPVEPHAELPPKTVVFIDNRLSAGRIACYLCWRISDSLKSSKIVSHLHSAMSQDYITRVFAEFKSSDAIRVLISTSVASNGIDVSNIERVVCIGAPQNIEQLMQEWGRGGRNPTIETICLAVVEPWVLQDDNTKKPTNKEKRTPESVIECMRLKTCRREFLRARNADNAPNASKYSVSYCCNNHDNGFKLESFFPGPFLYAEPVKPKKNAMRTLDNRPKSQREPLRQRIEVWKTQARPKSTLTQMWPSNYLPSKEEINRIILANPQRFTLLSDLVSFLQETADWAQLFGSELFNILKNYDAEVAADIAMKKQAKKTAPRAQKKIKQEASDPTLEATTPSLPPSAAYQHNMSSFSLKDEPWTHDLTGIDTPGPSTLSMQLPTSSQTHYPSLQFEDPLVSTMRTPSTRKRRSNNTSQSTAPQKQSRTHQD
ncbi:P-loop containing nucleoside triphosphate hydrolase protein [Coniophora puteana RWD-64-598 SS2]|uniref:DNA 3'-5' helicase n=1 Tax=Coniophora puteana (strain RWD-64-598) TaxID=741705 RepID=R7SD57_CONPW|nr:P-loop containing nucleoside triphosphate hydrolase protein [Coniophora puteana RWD-64-598 SS2]EIW74098.1 P-loop containing nucleoside triphosphate hydrolase protein [Coniophora puteana RWD-64-598 SS2]